MSGEQTKNDWEWKREIEISINGSNPVVLTGIENSQSLAYWCLIESVTQLEEFIWNRTMKDIVIRKIITTELDFFIDESVVYK